MQKKEVHSIFTEIYEKEADSIFRFCAVRMSSREQALDLVQETFLRLWKTLIEGTRVENARPFLFRVARNLVIDCYRRKKSVSLEGLVEGDSFEGDLLLDKSASDLELETEGRHLVDAINKLPSSYRDALYLRFVEGLPPVEVGDILGISSNAASARISRGISELRRRTGYEGIEAITQRT